MAAEETIKAQQQQQKNWTSVISISVMLYATRKEKKKTKVLHTCDFKYLSK